MNKTMITDTPKGQTNHCQMCEDAAGRIAYLESYIEAQKESFDEIAQANIKFQAEVSQLKQREMVLVELLGRLNNHAEDYIPDYEDYRVHDDVAEILSATPAQTADQVLRWHIEWMRTLPVAGYEFAVWDGRKRVEVLAIDYVPQQHPIYGIEEVRGKIPLVAIPPLPDSAASPETDSDKALRHQ